MLIKETIRAKNTIRTTKKTLPSLLLFLRLSLPKPIWKKVLHVWCRNDGKTACALSVHSRFGAFGLIPRPLGGIILTGVHLVSVFSNKHTVTHAILFVPLHGSKICFRFCNLCFPLLRGLPVPRKKPNIHIAARAFLRYKGQLLSACFVLILSILGFHVT